MGKYLVKITPLEPYSFGTDRNFKYPGEKETGKETYYVGSKEIPEQTMVLGLLRYLVLKEEGLLKSSFDYTDEDRVKMAECIGEKSFSYREKTKQNFGYIKEISPIFLYNEEGIWVRNPFNNKEEKQGYCPMEMMDTKISTSYGEINLPKDGEYNSKAGHANGYINLKDKTIKYGLFKKETVTGNKIDSEEDGFFKREIVILEKGYSFAVIVDADKLPKYAIGYMGKKKSTFKIETEPTDIDLRELVQRSFTEGHRWYYALSDVVIDDKNCKYENFCIVEEKYQRNLETVYKSENGIGRVKKSEIRYHLIQSGSVFFDSFSIGIENDNAKQIGYNTIIELGGM